VEIQASGAVPFVARQLLGAALLLLAAALTVVFIWLCIMQPRDIGPILLTLIAVIACYRAGRSLRKIRPEDIALDLAEGFPRLVERYYATNPNMQESTDRVRRQVDEAILGHPELEAELFDVLRKHLDEITSFSGKDKDPEFQAKLSRLVHGHLDEVISAPGATRASQIEALLDLLMPRVGRQGDRS